MSERRRVGSKRAADGGTQPGSETSKLPGKNGPEKAGREQKAEGTRWSTITGCEWTRSLGGVRGTIKFHDKSEKYRLALHDITDQGMKIRADHKRLKFNSRREAEVAFEEILRSENQ